MYKEDICCGHRNCSYECVCIEEYCSICDKEHDCVCDANTDAYLERDLDF